MPKVAKTDTIPTSTRIFWIVIVIIIFFSIIFIGNIKANQSNNVPSVSLVDENQNNNGHRINDNHLLVNKNYLESSNNIDKIKLEILKNPKPQPCSASP